MGGGGGGGERGHVTETDRRAGGRRRPRVRAGAGAPRSPPPARGLGSPRPAPEPPKCNFPCRRLAARGAFPGGFWTEEGETRRRPQNEVSAGAGRARGASGAGAADWFDINLINYNFTLLSKSVKSSSLISTQFKCTQIHLYFFCASTALGYYYFVYVIDASTRLCVT